MVLNWPLLFRLHPYGALERLGFAYRPFKDENTAIRGGDGVHYLGYMV
jgi:hypothetical protein